MSRSISHGGLWFHLRLSHSPDRPDRPPPRQTGDGGTNDHPNNTRFAQETNEGKQDVRAKFRLVLSLTEVSGSVSVRLSLRLSQTHPHPGKWATEGQPITRPTPDMEGSQTRVNDTPMSRLKAFCCSQGVPGPSHSVSPRHATRHAPTLPICSLAGERSPVGTA